MNPNQVEPKLDPNIAAVICYTILMDDYIEKAPSYMVEKIVMLNMGLIAFQRLDYKNKGKVMAYLIHWKLPIPPEWDATYLEELKLAGELGYTPE